MRKISDITNEEFRTDMLKTLNYINEGGDLTVVNNHNNRTFQLDGYVILDDCLICPVFKDTPYFSLNALYLSGHDNKLHVSRASVAGTVVPMNHNDSVEDAIHAYNKEREESVFPGRKITDYKIY